MVDRRSALALAMMVAAVAAVAAMAAAAVACGGGEQDDADPDVVRVDGGSISGLRKGDLHVYLGVPYAAPPVGELRWRVPQPVEPWSGVRRCEAYGSSCPQSAAWAIGPLSVGATSEDCLYLNISTPARVAGERLPVMVWIHGGGFAAGSGSQSVYDGAALARRGVVVVTANYRLGAFGFLAHPALSAESPDGVSGNYGLRDQVAVLQWVRRNIVAFGGDPDRVTVFGESAGGMSVCYLMTSPLAAGLFQRAIVQSGPYDGGESGMGAVRPLADAERIGERFAMKLGVSAPAGLRARSTERVLAAAEAVAGSEVQGAAFAPIVDGVVLPELPAAVFERGGQMPVPLMVGANADEADIFLAMSSATPAEVRAMLRRAYGRQFAAAEGLFPARGYGDRRRALSRLATVMGFWARGRSAAAAADRAGAPSYLYLFSRVPPVARARGLGAIHGLEVPYVFGNPVLGLDFDSGADARVSTAMGTAWTRFAATGDPNGPGLPRWPLYDPATRSYLEFGDRVRRGARYCDEACDLADSLRRRRVEEWGASE